MYICKIIFILMLLFKVALGQSCGWRLFECHGVRGAGSRLSDKRLCPRRCLTRPLGAHHPEPRWPPPAYLGRALLLNELWHRLEEMSFSSTTNCRGWLFKAEDAQIYRLPPRRCGYSRPISHVRPTGGCWRCRPSLGDTIWAVLPRGQGNRGRKMNGLTSAGSPCDAFCSSRRRSSWVVVQQGLFGEGTAAPALAGGLAAPAWASAGTRLNKLWENSWTPTEFRQHLEDFFFFSPSFYLGSALALWVCAAAVCCPKLWGPGSQRDAGGQETLRKGPWVHQVYGSTRRRAERPLGKTTWAFSVIAEQPSAHWG